MTVANLLVYNLRPLILGELIAAVYNKVNLGKT